MKLPSFEYAAPLSVADAVELLSSHDGNTKVLAGGQSLMPMLAFRLLAPELLVDLKRIQGLGEVAVSAGGVRLGSRVRWCDIENDHRLVEAQPLLCEAVHHIAHYQIRNRGTVGGSLAHADLAAELPAIAVVCDAELTIAGRHRTRTETADAFFLGALTTTLEADELITEIRFPTWQPGRRWAFLEFSRRRGDFALAGVALYYDLDAVGRAINVHIATLGASDRTHRLSEAEAVLEGHPVNYKSIAATAAAARAEVNPNSDIHAPAEYRCALVHTLIERGLRLSVSRNPTQMRN